MTAAEVLLLGQPYRFETAVGATEYVLTIERSTASAGLPDPGSMAAGRQRSG
ncbi:hypothetical protein [Kitasatospora sp. GAS1066B]|uniref:hypothetical protein n=1 Tax=Kitasatospora sp. GAS1066B TaxID=3156271 RepID=UPI00247BB887|nr:hypothetical protein [Kitasatospora sp. GAS204B]